MTNNDIPEMVFIPGGSFMMGSSKNERDGSSSEKPQHKVTVPAFYMGQSPVTQNQYQAVMGKNPSYFSHRGDNKPVELVSWNDAITFCRKLSQQTGRKYRLPSEAEWEYACRAGTTTPFYFGESITTDLANCAGIPGNGVMAAKDNYRQKTTEVGSFPPNAFGLYDMHGNVWEWCEDVWHSNYEGAPTDGSAWTEGNNQERVLRGGSWNDITGICRSAFRYSSYAVCRDVVGGFRVACDYTPPFSNFGF
jgi:formylglycine-generating enzyme required for sulfatase activity